VSERAGALMAVTEKVYLNEAMGWVDRSIATRQDTRTNMRTKAELLAAAGNSRKQRRW